jgi:hypothetical protein
MRIGLYNMDRSTGGNNTSPDIRKGRTKRAEERFERRRNEVVDEKATY